MDRIVAIAVEHDNQATFGWDIHADTPPLSLALALQRIRFEIETAPGKVTSVSFVYDTDEEE